MTVLRLGLSKGLHLSPAGRRLPPRFLPTRLPGLAFWYNSEVSSYAGGTWSDLSGNNNHALQPSASARPIVTTDGAGRRLLRFDGINDALRVANPPNLSAGATFFVVYRVRTPVDFRGIFTASAATGTDHQQFFTLQYEQAANRRIQVFGRSIQPNQLFTLGVDSTLKQYALATLANDGVTTELRDLTGITTDSSTFAPFGTPAAIILGARYNDDTVFRFGAVDLYEVGLFNRELSPAERDQLEAYVRLRQRLTWEPRFLGKDLAWFHDVNASEFVLSGGLVDQWSRSEQPWPTLAAEHRGTPPQDHGWQRPERHSVRRRRRPPGRSPARCRRSSRSQPPPSIGFETRGDFDGVLTAAPPAGADHVDFWTFRDATAASLEMELFGRSAEADQLSLSRVDNGAAQIAVWTAGSGTAELRDGAGSSTDAYGGSFGAPTEIVLGGRYAGAPFGYAAIDVLATVGATRALSATEQARLVAWANAKWSLCKWLTGGRRTFRTAPPTGSPITRSRSRRRSMPGCQVTRS